MDDTVKIIIGVALLVGVGLLVREFSGANEPEAVRTCSRALDELDHEVRREGTDTCREIDSVRAIADRGVTAASAEGVVADLRIYINRPPHGCRSLTTEIDVANAIQRAADECSAAARAHASE
jgi:hypothetical protein